MVFLIYREREREGCRVSGVANENEWTMMTFYTRTWVAFPNVFCRTNVVHISNCLSFETLKRVIIDQS